MKADNPKALQERMNVGKNLRKSASSTTRVTKTGRVDIVEDNRGKTKWVGIRVRDMPMTDLVLLVEKRVNTNFSPNHLCKIKRGGGGGREREKEGHEASRQRKRYRESKQAEKDR